MNGTFPLLIACDVIHSFKTIFPIPLGQVVTFDPSVTKCPAERHRLPFRRWQVRYLCTSFYMDAGFDVLYPFGYGLSYTTFAYSNVKLSAKTLKKNEVLTVTFDLQNIGKQEATEVAQLYVRDKSASVTRPVKELKRFTRVTLKPGEKTYRWNFLSVNLLFGI